MHDQWNSPVSPGSGAGERGRNYLIQASPGDGGPGVRAALLRHHSPDSSGSEAIPGTGIKKDRVTSTIRNLSIVQTKGIV